MGNGYYIIVGTLANFFNHLYYLFIKVSRHSVSHFKFFSFCQINIMWKNFQQDYYYSLKDIYNINIPLAPIVYETFVFAMNHLLGQI